jgi:hypothetical protein
MNVGDRAEGLIDKSSDSRSRCHRCHSDADDADLATAVPEICTDAPGFDRVAFHKASMPRYWISSTRISAADQRADPQARLAYNASLMQRTTSTCSRTQRLVKHSLHGGAINDSAEQTI